MKHYTQDDIVTWQIKTFGPLKDDLTCLIRANMEMAELLTHINAEEYEEAAIEAADVMIVLTGYGKSKGIDLFACEPYTDEAMKYGSSSVMRDASIAYYYLARLIGAVVGSQRKELSAESKGFCETWKHWVSFVIHRLHSVAFKLGHSLDDLVDNKMAVNEAREWACNGDGTGSHVKKTLGGAELHGVFIPAAPDDAFTEEGNWVFRPGRPPEFMKKGDPRI